MGVSAHQRDQYAEAMGRVIDQAVKAADHASEAAGAFVTQAYSDIAHQLAQTPAGLWTRQGLGKIEAALGEVVDQMGLDLTGPAAQGIVNGARLGEQSVVGLLGPDGVAIASYRVLSEWPAISPALVNVLADFSADLIQQLEKDVRDEIAGYVSRSIVTGRSQIETIQEIEQTIIGAGGTQLRFGSFFERAITQYQTESLRAFSLTQEVRGTQLAAAFPGTRKWWDQTPRKSSRKSHAACEDRTKANPIPFEELYEVGNVRLKMPRDPGGEGSDDDLAAETINCACSHRFVLPTGGGGPLPVDESIGADAVSDLRSDVTSLANEVLS